MVQALAPFFAHVYIVLTHEKILSEKSGGIAWGHSHLIQVDFYEHKGHRAEISIATLISGPSPIK